MATDYSVDDLLEFLTHASERGLMPAPTAQSLAVAVRNVFGVLGNDERSDLRNADIDGIVKRFTNKRAKEFNPNSLKEYGRRVHRAVELFLRWRENPADFAVKTRTTNGAKRKERNSRTAPLALAHETDDGELAHLPRDSGGYQSSFPIRQGRVVTISNLPIDLSVAEAERLAQFVRMLAVES
jgi:hypothetical protein